MKQHKTKILFFLLLAAFLLPAARSDASDAGTENADQGNSLSGLSVSFSYGFDKACKYGRQMNIIADITNGGDDFSGTIGILYRSEDEENGTLYEVPCVLAEGETKKIEFSSPSFFGNRPVLLIKDDKEQTVFQKTFQVSVTTAVTIPFVGVLTKDSSLPDTSSFSHSARVFFLDKNTLPSTAAGLDSLDILLISNYETSRLSSSQVEALLQWTKNGGTLVFFTGSDASRTLSAFRDELFQGTSERSFSLLSNSLCLMKLSDFIPVLSRKDGFALMVKNTYGNGTVFAAAFELGRSGVYEDAETDLLTIIKDNFSETAKKRLQENSSYYYDFSNFISYALNSAELNSYPHLQLYVLILLGYALITGPVLYMILKKADKRHLLWILMPVSCLLCTLIIYLAGSSSRITEPYIRYLSFQKIDLAGETKTSPAEIFFHITAPYNKKYSVSLSRLSNLETWNNGSYAYYSRNDFSSENVSVSDGTVSYKTALYQGNQDSTTLIINDYAAFHSASFLGSFTETDAFTGSVDSDIRVKKDYSLSGTLKNHLGFSLKQAVYISNGQAYLLGDLADGAAVSLADCRRAVLNSADSLENMDSPSGQSLISLLAGGDGWNSSTPSLQRQLYFAYKYYLTCESSLLLEDGHILAAAEKEPVSVFDESGLSADGLQLVDIRISPASFSSGSLECLDRSFSSVVSGNSFYPSDRYVYENSMIVSFHISRPEEITALVYSEYANSEFDSALDSAYIPVSAGTVSAYNTATGKYDLLFTMGKAGIFKNLDDYITSDGELQLYYQPLISEQEESGIFPMLYLLRKTQ